MDLSIKDIWYSNNYIITIKLIKYKLIYFYFIARLAIYISCKLYNHNIN